MKHTEGLLEYWSDKKSLGGINGYFIAPKGKLPTLAHVYNYPGKTKANAQRIIDCWNGCVGIENPLAIKELLKACKRLMQHKGNGDLHSIDFQRVRQTINNVEGS